MEGNRSSKPISTKPKGYKPLGSKEPSITEYFANYPSAKGGLQTSSPDRKIILIIGQHRYYNQFSAQLADVKLTRAGALKNPLTTLNPLDFVWSTQSPEIMKFYAGIAKFQVYYEKSLADLEGLKALVNNPLSLECYLHDSHLSEKPTVRSIRPVQISCPPIAFAVKVVLKENNYLLQGELSIGGTAYPTDQLALQLDYFITWGDYWYLCEDLNLLRCIEYFLKQDNYVRVTPEDFPAFRQEVLTPMETYIDVDHTYMEPPVMETSSANRPEKLIYLSDQEDHVSIHPVVKYGATEIPLLSRQQLYSTSKDGTSYRVDRHEKSENDFLSLLIKQHDDFMEQLDNPLQYFYLHKSHFLDPVWFLRAFEDWTSHEITVFGFDEISGNNFAPHKASISIHVSSGLNWFNAQIDVKFGKKKAALKEIRKAVKAKTRFVRLDDGTLGILPKEWLDRLQTYFGTGEVQGDVIQIPKVSFAQVSSLYETSMMDQEVKEEIHLYQEKLKQIDSLPPVEVPEGLQGTLRPYQVQGLNWLNFLDDFNFGGCLADDMGLGKTLQIIAFILLLRKKHGIRTHLLVVPTSLIENWQNEIRKFAPSISTHIHHGAGRKKRVSQFEKHELIITTYTNMVGDVSLLRKHTFEYILLDESQNIKNITSQRYKAARLLQSRNKIVLSGTPMENNTFDLYAQLSFVCPGLLGTRSQFKNTYALTIDKFKNQRSVNDLQKKISPFMLRRTKREVADDLPEKTEVILHCEMGPEQRKIYDAYEREFREYLSATDEEEIVKHPMHTLRGITRLRQICDAPVLAGVAAEGISAKIDLLMEQIKSLIANHKILIFSQFVSMLELIERALRQEHIAHLTLTGKTRKRGALVDKFQNDEDQRVFLISLKAGGTGLNLTAADYVFLVDPWWNPAVENQAIDRCYRIGQEKKVIAVRLITPDTVEEKIQTMQQTKSRLVDKMVTTDGFFKSLSRRDWLHLAGGS